MANRFAFGRNWRDFLTVLNEDRIVEAQQSLRSMLESQSLSEKTFVDVGSGSGLFALSAILLDAARVHSFDRDPDSVACTSELKRRYSPCTDRWTIERGDVLDTPYLANLGEFDVVYSWGVLHHTGNMWQALENVGSLVRTGGRLFIAIYNDQGRRSRVWKKVKAFYCGGRLQAFLVRVVFVPTLIAYGFMRDLLIDRKNPLARYRQYWKSRGMSVRHDWIDWLGGYPFEVAKPEAILEFYRQRGFESIKLKTTRSHGVNQYVFLKVAGQEKPDCKLGSASAAD